MNARLSMLCSLKRTKRREDNSVRLRVRSRVRLHVRSRVRLHVRSRVRLSVQPQHSTFENFSCGPEMPFEARFLQSFY